MITDERFEPGTRIRLKGCGLPGARPRFATIVQNSFRKMPVGWVIAETDDGCRGAAARGSLRGDRARARLIHFARGGPFSSIP
jgi:hypothetical protein